MDSEQQSSDKVECKNTHAAKEELDKYVTETTLHGISHVFAADKTSLLRRLVEHKFIL